MGTPGTLWHADVGPHPGCSCRRQHCLLRPCGKTSRKHQATALPRTRTRSSTTIAAAFLALLHLATCTARKLLDSQPSDYSAIRGLAIAGFALGTAAFFMAIAMQVMQYVDKRGASSG